MSTKSASKPLLVLAVGASTLAGIGAYAWTNIHRPKVLELYVFDVPGAPAVFIRTPEDKRVLIDGGSNSDIIRRLTDILPFYSRRIDMLIATHPDGKHVTGLIDVLDRYQVDQVVLPAGISSTDPIYLTFRKTIDDHKVPLREVVAGESMSFDEKVSAEVLFPALPDQFEYSKASAPQLMLKIVHGKNEIVLAGDATTKIQKHIAMKNQGGVDALVVSTGLSSSNISTELITSFRPEYLVYSQSMTLVKPKYSSDKKQKADPVAGILKDHRFNIREKGTVKIVSDEMNLKI